MNSSFAEKRLSAKIIENHRKSHHGHSKSGGAAAKHNGFNSNTSAIQYENLML